MGKWIDADALKERLIQNIALTNAIDRSFSEAPSIDIVFCKGCKHYHELWGCTKNPNEYLVVELDDFCSRGERREP